MEIFSKDGVTLRYCQVLWMSEIHHQAGYKRVAVETTPGFLGLEVQLEAHRQGRDP